MCRKLLLSVLILTLVGCSADKKQAGSRSSSGSFTYTIEACEEDRIAMRDFRARETADFIVESEKPLMIGFRADLDDVIKAKLSEKAKDSQNFEDNFSARVDALPTGNGIGALDGGCIVVEPYDGKIKFRFTNLLNVRQKFELYSMEATVVQ